MSKTHRKEDILRSELPPTLPLMALRSTIVYPLGTIAVQMGAPENLALLRSNEEPGLIVALVVASGELDEPIDHKRFIGRVGVAARVHERINLPGETVQITLQGLRRIVIESIEQVDPFSIAGVSPARETSANPTELDDLVTRVVTAAETLADLVDRIPDEVPQILKMNVSDPGRFADLAATNMNVRISDKDEVLQRLDVGQRIRFILSRLEREVARARVMEDVKKQTEIKIEQHQREFYLRQQLRAIQAELGETDPGEKEAVETLKKIDEARLPEKVGQEARRETERMRMLSPASSEYQVIRTYLDWILSLPWHAKSGDEDIVATLERLPQFPEIPTFHEQGVKNFEVSSWTGVVAPAQTPPEIVKKLYDAIAKVMTTSDMKNFMASQGAEVALLGPQEFGRYIEQEMVKWGKVARAAKLSASD